MGHLSAASPFLHATHTASHAPSRTPITPSALSVSLCCSLFYHESTLFFISFLVSLPPPNLSPPHQYFLSPLHAPLSPHHSPYAVLFLCYCESTFLFLSLCLIPPSSPFFTPSTLPVTPSCTPITPSPLHFPLLSPYISLSCVILNHQIFILSIVPIRLFNSFLSPHQQFPSPLHAPHHPITFLMLLSFVFYHESTLFFLSVAPYFLSHFSRPFTYPFTHSHHLIITSPYLAVLCIRHQTLFNHFYCAYIFLLNQFHSLYHHPITPFTHFHHPIIVLSISLALLWYLYLTL